MRKIYAFLFLISIVVVSALAAPIDDAKKLYNEGQYAEAVSRLQALKKKSPRDGNVNYWLGASLLALGRDTEAIEPLTVAEKRGVAAASRILTELAFDRYDIDAADDHLEAWEASLSKNKKVNTEALDGMRSRLVMMRNMLERVERIEIIDSINVDSAEFFTHYRLSPEAGMLLTPEDAEVNARTMVYMPQNKREMIWAESDSSGYAVLTSASILDDGTLDRPAPLKGDFTTDGDADFPFMMADGVTLYYAATGENSLGGYDIFFTRRNDDGFLQPQNVGMPYNSPYNDYMLVIDEATGAGWFASDRNQIPGKVTIYTFIPSQSRVNYDTEDPALASRARISSIADTQSSIPAVAEIRSRIAALDEGGRSNRRSRHTFNMSMGNGDVYTSLDDFKNMQARKEMAMLLKEEGELRQQNERLDVMRMRYRNGDRTVETDILDTEAAVEYLRDLIADRRNKVIRLEIK